MTTPTELFNYELPEELIAQEPLVERASSRLLKMDRATGGVRHSVFSEIPSMLNPGDLLVVNETKVFPARLRVKKETGAEIELLFLKKIDDVSWDALARPGRRLKEGTLLYHGSGTENPFCVVAEKSDSGVVRVSLNALRGDELFEFLSANGETPLPPYIKKKSDDPERYQTVYAGMPGSSAAPTAGMHFTKELLAQCESAGASFAKVTLHIGLDTFRPVATPTLEEHVMHSEYYDVPDSVARAVLATRKAGGRVIAVGTTSVRSLESWAVSGGDGLPAGGSCGDTRLFIFKREQFRVTDAIITNFHLPGTTLLAMICAFAGRENVLAAYGESVRMKYRFFSFGDAMFIS